MKTLRRLLLFTVLFTVLLGCSKKETGFSDQTQNPQNESRLKAGSALGDFGALGTVQLASEVITNDQTVFTYTITPGPGPISGLNLEIDYCSIEPIIINCTNAVASYGIDQSLKSSSTYKSIRWLKLTQIVPGFPIVVSFTLDGFWIGEPGTAMLKVKSGFAVAQLPVPVCQDPRLAVVETIDPPVVGLEELQIKGQIVDAGLPPYQACGIIFWSSSNTPDYPTDVDRMKVAGVTGIPGEFSVIFDKPVDYDAKRYYFRAYALNNFSAYSHELVYSYGEVLANELLELDYGTAADDRPGGDGYIYKTIVIGQQTWMAENLRYIPYVNPDLRKGPPGIFVYGYTGSSVEQAKATDNYEKYGCLYTWEAAKSACPPGWDLPTDEEWRVLEHELGMSWASTALQYVYTRLDGDIGNALKSTDEWFYPKNPTRFYVGNNSSGFNALSGGKASHDLKGFSFSNIGGWTHFWTSTPGASGGAYHRGLTYFDQSVYRGIGSVSVGYSVRCIKD